MSRLFDPHHVARIVITATIFGAFGLMFLPFWKPLMLAALFAFALARWVDRIGPKQSRRLPTLMILTGFSLVLTVPLLFVVLRVVRSVSYLSAENLPKMSLYQSTQRMMEKWQTTIQDLAEQAHIAREDAPQPVAILSKGAAWLVDQATAVLSNVPDLVISLFVFTTALYVLLTEAAAIRRFFLNLKILEKRELDQIVEIVQRSSYVTLVVSALIGAVQAMVVALGALAVGYNDFFLIFIITFFASFVPVIGAAPVAVLLALLSLANGEIGGAIALGVVAAVAGSVDNLIKPFLVSSSSESSVHPVVALVATIGAVVVYGIPGLLLGPILIELTMRIIPVLFREVEAAAATSTEGQDL